MKGRGRWIRRDSPHLPLLTEGESKQAFIPCGPSGMAELAFYPAVALVYFFGVLQASREERVELSDRASINVFCLFVFIQPLCLVLGGYTGMATYLITALVSYNVLPWKKERTGQRGRGQSQKKKEKNR